MTVAPTQQRIVALDIIRGVALLGILIMNIQAFAMPFAAYMNPYAFGDMTGINGLSWGFTHLFSEGKFITLFTFLFGAGVAIFIDSVKQQHPTHFLRLHYRRMTGLILFGMIHAYFIWFGDVLVLYGLCGLWLCFFVHLPPRILFAMGILLNLPILLLLFVENSFYTNLPATDYQDYLASWAPGLADIQADIAAMTGSWWQIHQLRVELAIDQQINILAFCLDTTGTMLLGIGLYRTGVLSGAQSTAFYRHMAFYGLTIGFFITLFGMSRNFSHHWSLEYASTIGASYAMFGRFFVALGYIGLIQLAIRGHWFGHLQQSLAAVGQMAFSQYIFQSLIASLIFYGYGLGWYGQSERYQLLIIVVLIWLVQLRLSRWWLQRFQFGPLEWLWRSLTYGQWQVMAKPPQQ